MVEELKKILVDGEERYMLPDMAGIAIFVSKEIAEALLKGDTNENQ